MGEDDLVRRALSLAGRAPRVILGLAGAPGAGKSTLAAALVAASNEAGVRAALLPMDGYHLADVTLDRLGRRDRKGAVDTFDGFGYLATIRRLRTESTTVYAPGFERTLEQPIAGAVAIDPDVRLVVTEGNYLLLPDEPWSTARAEMTETWFVEVPDELRLERLVARHILFGKPEPEARAWVESVDEPNARLITATRGSADLIVGL